MAEMTVNNWNILEKSTNLMLCKYLLVIIPI